MTEPSTQHCTSSNRENPWAIESVRVSRITDEIENVKTLHLEFEDEAAGANYCFRPGQFNMLYQPGAGESAISMSDDPASCQVLDHTIRIAGNVTSGICALKIGDTLALRGPFGTGWPMESCESRDVILVTGGIGLPPLRPAILDMIRQRERFGQINLLYGARSPEGLLYVDEYDWWESSGLNIHLTVDRSATGWLGSVGVVTLLLDRLKTFDPENSVLFCCGPEVMMRFVARTAIERGIDASRIWVSTERNMNCAIGLCGHCQLAGSFICKDGPVLRYDLIEPYLKVQGL